MKYYIQKIIEGNHLTREEAASAMRTIMEGKCTDAQIAAFLIGLRTRGEHTDELLGFVEVMREKAVSIRVDDPDAIDMCGTGGDGSGTFNISTVASFVAAGAGVTIAKHGNRSVSSSCGSADVLKVLGVNVERSPQHTETCINTTGIGFLFAPLFHPAMKYAAKPRSELGVKTCFNILGPMTNPAGVRRQLVGAFNTDAARKMAAVFSKLGTKRIFIVAAECGMDEIALEGKTHIHEIGNGNSENEFTVDAGSFGMASVSTSALRGGTPEQNASIALGILSGKTTPHREVVIANAAFGLMAAGKTRTIDESVALCAEAIDSGRSMEKFKQFKEFYNR